MSLAKKCSFLGRENSPVFHGPKNPRPLPISRRIDGRNIPSPGHRNIGDIHFLGHIWIFRVGNLLGRLVIFLGNLASNDELIGGMACFFVMSVGWMVGLVIYHPQIDMIYFSRIHVDIMIHHPKKSSRHHPPNTSLFVFFCLCEKIGPSLHVFLSRRFRPKGPKARPVQPAKAVAALAALGKTYLTNKRIWSSWSQSSSS